MCPCRVFRRFHNIHHQNSRVLITVLEFQSRNHVLEMQLFKQRGGVPFHQMHRFGCTVGVKRRLCIVLEIPKDFRFFLNLNWNAKGQFGLGYAAVERKSDCP